MTLTITHIKTPLLVRVTVNNTHHHPVLGVHHMHRPFGLSLNGLVEDATSYSIDQHYPDEAALLVQVCALSHHRKKIGVQVLEKILDYL